jgi:hypothetical protein
MIKYVGIDPGPSISGLCFMKGNQITSGVVTENSNIMNLISKFIGRSRVKIIFEDIANQYSVRFGPDTINTCKVIGYLQAKFEVYDQIEPIGISRDIVRKWVFDTFQDIAIPRIEKKIAYLDDYGAKNDRKRYRKQDGELRKPSHVFVDDRIVTASMKELYSIPTPKPGKANKYGLKSHSWQALAVLSCFKDLGDRSGSSTWRI